MLLFYPFIYGKMIVWKMMMSKLFKPATLAVAILSAVVSSQIFAKNDADLPTLEPIVITVSKTEQPISTAPARIHVIDKKTIEQNPVANLDHVLKNDASANIVTSGGVGQTSSIFLRGTNSNHTLVLRDGVRLNTASTGTANSAFLDMSDIQRVEVLKGASSVLYGTDAIGGVVHMISQKPEKTGGFITGVYGENDTYKGIVGANFVKDGFYAQVRGQKMESDGTPVKDFTNAPDAGYKQKGGGAKVGYENDKIALSVDYSRNQGNNEYDNFGSATSQDFKNEFVNVKGRAKINDKLTLNARLSEFKDLTKQKDKNYLNDYDFTDSQSKEKEIYAVWQFTPQQNILLGMTHRNLKGDILSYGTGYQKDVSSKGYFIQHQYSSDEFDTQAGVRLEDHDEYGKHTVYQTALRYHFTPNTSLYTNFGSAFRSPHLNELYGYGGNKDLKPEQSTSLELGLEHKLVNNTALSFSAYHTKVKDLISYGCIANCGAATASNGSINIDNATIQGVELGAKTVYDDFFAQASYHYSRTKDKNTREELSRRPRHNAVVTVGFENDVYGLSSSLKANSHYDNTAFDTHTISGHTTIDLNGYWNINQNIKLFGHIENIRDVKYATAFGSGSHYINGGRQANIGITLKY